MKKTSKKKSFTINETKINWRRTGAADDTNHMWSTAEAVSCCRHAWLLFTDDAEVEDEYFLFTFRQMLLRWLLQLDDDLKSC